MNIRNIGKEQKQIGSGFTEPALEGFYPVIKAQAKSEIKGIEHPQMTQMNTDEMQKAKSLDRG